MTKFFDAFISYGRPDSREFAVKLQNSLNQNSFQVWFDANDIPLGVDFQNQINDGIEKADNFLFIISPHSVNSEYCGKEIDLAIKCNKRIIPLMHVEEINRETWQQRNPNGTDEEWKSYKIQGKHDHFQNMHPTIRKINWVYFREDKDDFDKSLEGLIKLLHLHDGYVREHTNFLTKALEWERNQKQTRYLLTGEEKQQAEKWLKIRFTEEQPPCIPSDLHCEYITESIKNANNLMTQVMLSYAKEDRAMMEKIRASLRREGITVWTNTTDIQTGKDFVDSFTRGIEKADNLVYLLSPNSIKSSYCQQELGLAVEFNKRIIPLLVQKTEEIELPDSLQNLQYIDLTDNISEADYQLDESGLLKILNEDKVYYNEHKILLNKALKWKQQKENFSILLRGKNLESAETWLKVAQKRTQHPPIPLQSEFITASLEQPPLDSLDVFISYSRADSDLARKLNDALELQGKTTWFDQESIASASDFEKEIKQAIEASDNFLFILSPHSVNSPDCINEVEYAASLNKRCITVLYQQINTSDLHPILSNVHWIDFNSNKKDFNANFNQLLRTLETDRQHVQSHSKWLQKSLEWEQKNKNDDLLLRGSNFIVAQKWWSETEDKKKKPAITSLQKEFIQASQKAIELAEEEEKRRQAEMLRLQEEKRKEAEARLAEQEKSAKRQKRFLKIISILGLAAFIAAIFASCQRENAVKAQQKAQEAQLAQLDSLSRYSSKLSKGNLKFNALLEAISAGEQIKELKEKLPANKHTEEIQKTRGLISTALQAAVYQDGFREQNRLDKHNGTVFDVAWSPDGDKIASASGDGTIKLWNLNGKNTKTIKLGKDSEVYDVAWSPDGEKIASASGDGTIKLWNLNGKEINSKTVGDNSEVYSVSFYPDGETIAFTSDKTYGLWNTSDGNFQQTKSAGEKQPVKSVKSPDGKIIATVSQDNNNTVEILNKQGKTLQTLKGHKGSIQSIKFSPDGTKIATASEDNTVRIWSLSENELKKLKGDGEAEFLSVAWSPDGNTIASGRKENTIKIWTKKQGEWKLIPTQIKHNNDVKGVSFSPDGNTIAFAGENSTIKLLNNQGKLLKEIGKNGVSVTSVAWNPDGNTIASGAGDNTIKLWSKDGNLIRDIGKHWASVKSIAWSPDGNTIASGGGDKKIKLWSKQGKFLGEIGEHDASVVSVAWSPDGKIIASGSEDNTIKLWNNKGEGKEIKTLKGHNNDVLSVAFSPDGKTIASASKDGTVKLWNLDGKELQTLNGHNGGVTSVSFSRDGKTLASTSYDKTLILWDLEDLKLDKLLKNGCEIVKDYLESNATGEEKKLCN